MSRRPPELLCLCVSSGPPEETLSECHSLILSGLEESSGVTGSNGTQTRLCYAVAVPCSTVAVPCSTVAVLCSTVAVL